MPRSMSGSMPLLWERIEAFLASALSKLEPCEKLFRYYYFHCISAECYKRKM